jgi:hypothetical protein
MFLPSRARRRATWTVLVGLVIGLFAGATGASARTISDPTGICSGTYLRRVNVASTAQLTYALRHARPGDFIHLADGTYHARFTASVSGTASHRIIMCGSRRAILNGGSLKTGYGLHIAASYWTVAGFSVTNSLKGIMLDRAHGVILRGLAVYRIGDEGVHFRTYSSDNRLEKSTIHDVGLTHPQNGEGVYVGSAKANWGAYTKGKPDASTRNRILDNTIGPRTTAESVDVKEGTTGTIISNNRFSGVGMNATVGGDSWIDLKGNKAVVTSNTGVAAPLDGFQTHVILAGWGNDNVFRLNDADVGSTGYGFRIRTTGTGNVVGCDNVVKNAAAGFANTPCT